GDVCEHAERGHGEQPHRRVLRVAVHVLEGIEPTVGGGHQLDPPDARVARVAGRLLELAPAQKVALDLLRELLDETRRAPAGHQLPDALDTDEIDHDCSPHPHPGPPRMSAARSMVGPGGIKRKTETCTEVAAY